MTNSRMLMVAIAIGTVTVEARAAQAQQTQLDLHGDYVVGTSTHANSWGGGAGLQVTFGGKSDAVNVSVSPSVDYVKQQHSGPTQTSLSADLSIQPGGGRMVTPYAGISAGSNWSGGDAKQWDGTRLGLETLAGAQVKLGASRATLKVEERFGYVNGEEHVLTTRAGLLISY